MLRLILAFVEVAFHRRSPADLPASRVFFVAVLVVYVGVGLVTTRSLQIDKYPELDGAVRYGRLDFAFMWAVLRAFRARAALPSNGGAMLGADTFLNLVTVPLL